MFPSFTSRSILRADASTLADMLDDDMISYLPTLDEVKALVFIGNRYAVSALLLDHMGELPDGAPYIEVAPWQVAEALAEDGVDRVPMLSDETALQRMVWAIGPDQG